MSDANEEVMELIEKLLKKAAKTDNEHERDLFNAKAFDLMAQHGLSQAIIEQNSGGKGRRTDEKLKGGLYKYQRELWEAVAELNNCFYFHVYAWIPDKVRKVRAREDRWGYVTPSYTAKGGYEFQHRLVGRVVNVKGTQVMAEYLEQSIERLTRERLGGDGTQFFTKWAISYREGAAAELCSKLRVRRRQLIDEETLRKQELAQAARERGLDGSTGTELSLDLVAKQERDANVDFLYGEGTSAKWAARRAKEAESRRAAEAQYTAWAQANPEEAKREEEKARKEREKKEARRKGSYRREASYKGDASAYWDGNEAAKKISIDQQADRNTVSGLL